MSNNKNKKVLSNKFPASLTIFLVAIADWFLVGQPLSGAAISGGLLIIAAFLLLSWSTYREMDEERRKRYTFHFLFSVGNPHTTLTQASQT